MSELARLFGVENVTDFVRTIVRSGDVFKSKLLALWPGHFVEFVFFA